MRKKAMERTMINDVKSVKSKEQQLFDAAMEADVSVERLPGQSLEDFADHVVDAIADKIIDLNDLIEDIQAMDLDDEEDVA
jgi:hypothetical protein